MKNRFTVCVEGNIASGKTTFLKLFNSNLQFDKELPQVSCKVIEEPVPSWQNLCGHNILEMMYKDPHRWGHLFQSYVTLTMTQAHTLQIKESIKLMERSLLTAERCFAANLYCSGIMSKPEYLVLKEWYAYLNSHPKINVSADLIVYLRTTPETCFKRTISRSRTEESAISISYLKDLHKLHEECLIEDKSLTTPVIVVDAEQDFHEFPHLLKSVQRNILNYYEQFRQNDKENGSFS
ncbi:tdk [Lepeophtheirus salmonis]|uniref:Deoxynucleoside kinase n=1 Tax=Lepeophtheirus salmonis TaxID=72036 RepID=D3PI47_LEPSM|nr:Deoxynucleoside kinase [Lepeophtheirus salmonis]CAB4060392.1 tdk [Lepeophtheirus salmonis]CAF2864832.1 tdk [Lepeophtheirus salmonis]